MHEETNERITCGYWCYGLPNLLQKLTMQLNNNQYRFSYHIKKIVFHKE